MQPTNQCHQMVVSEWGLYRATGTVYRNETHAGGNPIPEKPKISTAPDPKQPWYMATSVFFFFFETVSFEAEKGLNNLPTLINT